MAKVKKISQKKIATVIKKKGTSNNNAYNGKQGNVMFETCMQGSLERYVIQFQSITAYNI